MPSLIDIMHPRDKVFQFVDKLLFRPSKQPSPFRKHLSHEGYDNIKIFQNLSSPLLDPGEAQSRADFQPENPE
jgi:hypothetical protein